MSLFDIHRDLIDRAKDALSDPETKPTLLEDVRLEMGPERFNVVDEAARGVRRGMVTIDRGIDGLQRMVVDNFGPADKHSMKKRDKYYNRLEKHRRIQLIQNRSSEMNTFDPRNPNWWVSGVSEAIPQLAGQLTLAYATGGQSLAAQLGTFAATGGSVEMGNYYTDAKQRWLDRGISSEDAAKHAGIESLMVGTVSSAIEVIPGSVLLRKNPAAKKAFDGFLRTRLASAAKRMGSGFLAEGTEEATQEAWGDTVRWLYERDRAAYDDYADRYKRSFAVGGAAGSLFSGVQIATSEMLDRLDRSRTLDIDARKQDIADADDDVKADLSISFYSDPENAFAWARQNPDKAQQLIEGRSNVSQSRLNELDENLPAIEDKDARSRFRGWVSDYVERLQFAEQESDQVATEFEEAVRAADESDSSAIETQTTTLEAKPAEQVTQDLIRDIEQEIDAPSVASKTAAAKVELPKQQAFLPLEKSSARALEGFGDDVSVGKGRLRSDGRTIIDSKAISESKQRVLKGRGKSKQRVYAKDIKQKWDDIVRSEQQDATSLGVQGGKAHFAVGGKIFATDQHAAAYAARITGADGFKISGDQIVMYKGSKPVASVAIDQDATETDTQKLIDEIDPPPKKPFKVKKGEHAADIRLADLAGRDTQGAIADFALTDAETTEGQSLVKRLKEDVGKSKPSVGLRSIAEFVLEQFHAFLVIANTQTSRNRPAVFREFGSVVYSRSGSWQVNLHEAGHALSSYLKDQNPQWYESMEGPLAEFAAQSFESDWGLASNESAEEGVAELVRLMITNYGAIPVGLRESFEFMLDGMSPASLQVLRDAHRAYQQHRARVPREQATANRNDKPARKSAVEGAADLSWGMARMIFGNSTVLHRQNRSIFKSLSGATSSEMLDPTGVIGSVKSLASESKKTRNKIAKELMDSIYKTKADPSMAYQNKLRLQASVNTAMQGGQDVEGIGLYLHGNGFNEFSDEQIQLLEDAGFNIPKNKSQHGEFQVLHDESFQSIKEGIEDWQGAQTAFQYRVAIERYEKGGHPYPGMLDGFAPQDLRTMVDDWFRENPDWDAAFKQVEQFMDQLLLIGLLAGQLTVDQAVAIKTTYEDYVPLPRYHDQSVGGSRVSAGVESPSFGVFRARGSHKEFLDLEEAVYRRAVSAFSAYYDNALLKSEWEMVNRLSADDRVPFDARKDIQQMMLPLDIDFKVVGHLSPSDQRAVVADYFNRFELQQSGMTDEVLSKMSREQIVAALEQTGGDIVTPDQIGIGMAGKPIFRAQAPSGVRNIVAFWENGQQRYFWIQDNLTFAMIGNRGGANKYVGYVAGMLAEVVDPWKRMFTQTFKFLMRNIPRDAITAAGLSETNMGKVPFYFTSVGVLGRIQQNDYSQEARLPAEKLARSLDHVLTDSHKSHSQKFGEILSEGVLIPGWGNMSWAERVGKIPGQLSALGSNMIQGVFHLPSFGLGLVPGMSGVSNWISPRWLSEQSETITREGIYIDARQRGFSPGAAQDLFEQGSGNFAQRQGDANLAAIFRAAGFLNPALQILWQISQSLTHYNPETRLGKNSLTGAMLASLGAVGAAINILLIHALYDDEEKDLILENMRERTEKEKLGNAAIFGSYRAPFDYGVFGSIVSFSWNSVEDELLDVNVDAKQRAFDILERASNIPWVEDVIPPHLKVWYELSENWSIYLDREIVPKFLMDKYPENPELQYHWDTPEFYKGVGKVAGISPIKIKYAIRGMFGATLDDTVRYLDKTFKGEATVWDNPITVGLKTWDASGFKSRSVQSLLEMDEAFESADRILYEKFWESPEHRKIIEDKRAGLQVAHAVMWMVQDVWKEIRQERDKPKPDFDRIKGLERQMTRIASDFIQKGKVDDGKLNEFADRRFGVLEWNVKAMRYKGEPTPPWQRKTPYAFEDYREDLDKFRHRQKSARELKNAIETHRLRK